METHLNFLVRLFQILLLFLYSSFTLADESGPHFRNAPGAAHAKKNPYSNDQDILAAGAKLYSINCASCHGANALGAGNIPSIATGPAQSATPGDLFWYIGKGSPENGMPASTLFESDRWKLVSFITSLKGKPANPALIIDPENFGEVDSKEPVSPAPFTDYRFEKPGQTHKILAKDLPDPKMSSSVGNGPDIVKRPANAWPIVPQGFKVELYETGLDNPRLIRTAPNGDFFLAESETGKIRIFRGITKDGKPQERSVFADGLLRPYGIAFYPPGPSPKWVYIGDSDAVLRFEYQSGDLTARAKPQKLVELPDGGIGHWTRDLQFSLDGKRLFVAVGSASNVDDTDKSAAEKNRADILVMTPEGKDQRVYAYGIRNAGGGLAVHPRSGELWASVNERDGLGDNLVADYITHIEEGGFYGWPWWYIGGHQDPRHKGTHPELRSKLINPDVLLQPHHASLQMAFYEGKQFPSEYVGDIFSSQHGSWNRSVRTGYELIRIPLHHTNRASGEYEDFMTGFVVDAKHVWGRPVGVTVATDGSLLVTDDGSNSIWRISHLPVSK